MHGRPRCSARETVERLSTLQVNTEPVLVVEDRAARWQREAIEEDERRERASLERTVETIELRLRGELAGMVGEKADFVLAVVTEALGATIKDLDSTADAMISAAIENLRADTNAQVEGLRADIANLRDRIEQIVEERSGAAGLRRVK
jgi:hypothetical protein